MPESDAERRFRENLDAEIRSINAEIDADTFRRFARGERLVPDGQGGYAWAYIVDAQGRVVDENGNVLPPPV